MVEVELDLDLPDELDDYTFAEDLAVYGFQCADEIALDVFGHVYCSCLALADLCQDYEVLDRHGFHLLY